MYYTLNIRELVEATMFLKPNKCLIPNNKADLAKYLIWNTLVPSRPELPDDIEDSDDDEEEEEEDLSPMPK